MTRSATGTLTTSPTPERLQALTRDDKWFLSCGDGIIWAPPFPTWLHHPGFWDEALVYYHAFAPLFSVALVDSDGDEISLERVSHRWRPDRIRTVWVGPNDARLVEERYALPGGRFVSDWSLESGEDWAKSAFSEAHLVAFTAQPGEATSHLESVAGGSGLRWRRTLLDRRRVELEVAATLFAATDGNTDAVPAIRMAAVRSESADPRPVWEHTPFWEAWEPGPPHGVTGEVRIEGVDAAGSVYAAVDVPLSAAGKHATFTIELAPIVESPENTDPAQPTAAAGEGSPGPAPPSRTAADSAWLDFFNAFPRFTCSDPYLERYYDYRLYGLHLNRLSGGCGNVRHPAVAEGIGYFHVPITYSAQCHMWEARWARDPQLAHGSLLNFLEHQRQDGSLHGRIYTNHLRGTDFYHANWGDAVLAVHAIHADRGFLTRAYDGLSKYAHWLDASRDPDRSGMYDIVNHFETGQEYMSRYQVVSPTADRDGWTNGMRLKGIDVTVYVCQLKRALGEMAEELGRDGDVEAWRSSAQHIGRAILDQMWEPQSGFFTDVDPRTMTRTGVRAAVGFYPLLTDLLDEEHVRQLLEHLTDPQEFGTPFPIPSSSVSDPLFDPEAHWKGKRHNCPWNGRVWPMINSHIIEGLLRQWRAGHRFVGKTTADILTRFIHMMFHRSDLRRPNCYEHYNPFTGHPSRYRGIDDYQHSWVLDLLVRGAAGVVPTHNAVLIDPLPIELADVALAGATIRGRSVSLTRQGDTTSIQLDGASYETAVGSPLEIPL